MPELPEVESIRRAADSALRGKRIVAVDASDGRSILSAIDARGLQRALIGRRVERSGRRGKYFWLDLDDGRALLLHLGMTGWLSTIAPGNPRPPYTRVALTLDDGSVAAFTDPRRFGKIRLLAGPAETLPPVLRLGADPLDHPPDARHLAAVFARRRIAVKALLLDQKVFAGVGNWIADEVLYQAGIRPDRLCATLKTAEISRLRTALRHVLRTAVERGADSDRFPKDWLFHHRWGKKKDARTARGERIVHQTIGGRTTAWVPTRQK